MRQYQSKLLIFYPLALLMLLAVISIGSSCTSKSTSNDESSQTDKSTSDPSAKDNQKPSSGDYEAYPIFKASGILDAEILKGDHYEVVEEVSNDCIWNSYTIKSDFGEYQARNTAVLKVRVNEIEATAQLKDISGGEAIAAGAMDSVINPFRSAINIATHPVDTAKGVPGGIITFFKKIYYSGEKVVVVAGQTAKNVGGAVTASGDEESGDKESSYDVVGNVSYLADWYLGISGGERRLAKKLGVDPYTSNPELAAELKRVAKYDRIGRLGLGFADIPTTPPGMGYVKDVNHYVWDKDPKELRDFNIANLMEMGIDEELVYEFIDSPYYSPTFQTAIVFSLMELPDVANREEIIEDAVVASSISESKFFMNIVLLLVWFNNTQSPLTEIINHADITSARTEDERIITIFPVDYLCWSEKVAEAARFHDKIFKNLDGENRQLWIVGPVSDRVKLELNNLGWEVVVQESIDVDSFGEDTKKEEATKGINKKAFDVFQDGNKDSGTQNNQ